MYCSQVWKLGRSKFNVTADSVSGEGHFLVQRWCVLVVFFYGGRDWLALWGLSYKGTNPNLEGSTLCPIHHPRPTLPPNTITLGFRIST